MRTILKPLLWGLQLLLWPFGAAAKWLEAHPEVNRWLKILRLGLFQFAVGLSLAPITGTLNRVLIDEMAIPAASVALLISLHYFVSPVRAIVGYRSDKQRSIGKWRTPYIVLGVMLTYGGLALAPFVLILLSGEGVLPFWAALIVSVLIFLGYGAGINIVETVYLAMVSDITPKEERGKVLSFLWMMLIFGTMVSAIIVSGLLVDYTHERLVQVLQGSAVWFVILTVIALFGQEQMRPDGTLISHLKDAEVRVRLSLWESVQMLGQQPLLKGLFAIIFIASMAFATHDVLLEPYGGQVLGMSVSATMQLTVIWSMSTIVGVILAALLIWRKTPPVILIGLGCAVGLIGFGTISYASDVALLVPFQIGVSLISIGRGLFLVGSVILVMSLTDVNHAGLFLGVWGIVQGIAQGIGTIGGGVVRDVAQAQTGSVVLGYTVVYATSLFFLLSVVLILLFSLGRKLRVDEIKMPWSGVEEIPADQLAF